MVVGCILEIVGMTLTHFYHVEGMALPTILGIVMLLCGYTIFCSIEVKYNNTDNEIESREI